MKKLHGRIRNSPQEMSQDWKSMQNMRPPETVLTVPLTGEDKVALQSKVFIILHTLKHTKSNYYVQLRMRSFQVEFKRV